jgi:hypothetical protein
MSAYIAVPEQSAIYLVPYRCTACVSKNTLLNLNLNSSLPSEEEES